jgi:hypothetical protein
METRRRTLPGFTAESSLSTCRTQYNVTATDQCEEHHGNRSVLLRRTVVPQLPVRIGKVCGSCTLTIGRVRFGIRRCADFSCDLQTFECALGDSAIELC